MATSQGVWDLSSPTGDLTWASCIRSKGSSPLDLTGAPSFRFDGAYHGSSVVLKVLCVLISSSQACDGCAPITSTLQTKPQRFREIEQLVQDHTDRNWDSWSTPAYRVVLEEWDRRLLHVQQFFPSLLFTVHPPLRLVLGQQAVRDALTGEPSGRGPGSRHCPTPVSAARWTAGTPEIDLDCCSYERCPPVPTQLALFGKVTVLTNSLVRSPGQYGCLSIFRLPEPCLCDELKISSEDPLMLPSPSSLPCPNFLYSYIPNQSLCRPQFLFLLFFLVFCIFFPLLSLSLHFIVIFTTINHQINFNKLFSAKCTVIAYWNSLWEEATYNVSFI